MGMIVTMTMIMVTMVVVMMYHDDDDDDDAACSWRLQHAQWAALLAQHTDGIETAPHTAVMV